VAIGPRLQCDIDREKALADALKALGETTFEHDRANILEALLPHLPEGVLREVLEKIECVPEGKARARLLVRASSRLPEHLVDRAWRVAQAIAGPSARAEALAAVARRFTMEAKRADALEEALNIFMAVGDEEARARVLIVLAPRLPEGVVRTEAFDEALRLATSLQDLEARIVALSLLATHRPEALRAAQDALGSLEREKAIRMLAERLPASEHHNLLHTASMIPDEEERVSAILTLIATLPETSQGEILRVGVAVSDEALRSRFIRNAAPHLRPAFVRFAVRAAGGIGDETFRRLAMEGLKPYGPRPVIIRLLQRLNAARGLNAARADVDVEAKLREAETFNDLWRARTLIDLAPLLPDRLWADALRICASIWMPHWRAQALEKMVSYLPEAMRADALRIAAEIDLEHVRGIGIAGVAPYLSEPLLAEALGVVETMHDWLGFTEAITGLAPYLDGPLLRRALTIASAHLTGGGSRVEALAALAPRLPPGPERDAVLSDTLRAAEAIESAIKRVESLRLLLPHLPSALQEGGSLVSTCSRRCPCLSRP
jgi:hypothetical protein